MNDVEETHIVESFRKEWKSYGLKTSNLTEQLRVHGLYQVDVKICFG